jgi:hypothetical protein
MEWIKITETTVEEIPQGSTIVVRQWSEINKAYYYELGHCDFNYVSFDSENAERFTNYHEFTYIDKPTQEEYDHRVANQYLKAIENRRKKGELSVVFYTHLSQGVQDIIKQYGYRVSPPVTRDRVITHIVTWPITSEETDDYKDWDWDVI